MIKIRDAILCAGMLTVPAVAMAQPINGFYISGGGGLNLVQTGQRGEALAGPFDNDPIVIGGSGFDQTFYKSGFILAGAGGYGFGNGLRLELEGSLRQNGLDKDFAQNFTTKYKGDEKKSSLMANVLFDLTDNILHLGLPVTPYFGGGVGVTSISWKGVDRYGTVKNLYTLGTTQSYDNIFNGSDTEFAYQGIAGVSYDIPGVRGLALTAEYRFMGIGHGFRQPSVLHINFQPGGPYSELTGPGWSEYPTDSNHSIMFGVRYSFVSPHRPGVCPQLID